MKRSARYFLALALTAALLLGAVMPALAVAAAPEATAAPVETTDESTQTAEQETTNEPEQTAEPEATDEPEETTGPEATDAPAVTDEPETTEEPVAEAASVDVVVKITAGGESRDYATIDEAWAAAIEAGTATVTLLTDVTAQDVLTVPAGASITFAGGENTLSTACIRVDGGTLTVASGTVQDAGDGSTDDMGAIRIDSGNLTVNGGTMRGLNSGVYCYGGDTTINGGVICGENGGLAVTDADSLTVNGGDISGPMAVLSLSDNVLTVNGGTISGEEYGIVNWNGLVLTGGEITGGNAGVMSTGDVTVTGGSVTGGVGLSLEAGRLTVTGGSITGTEGFGLLLGEESSASLSGGAYAGVGGAVSCGGVDIFGRPIETPLTVDDLLAYGYGWYDSDGALLTPAADEKALAGPVTVSPLPAAPATPVLKVEGENVLLSSDPSDIDQEYDAPLTDGALIEGGTGRIVVPAEYVVEFPDAGVEITEQRYKFDNRYEPDTPIYHRYVFEVTDPTMTELDVTVSPNPDTPTWTKVIAHTYADFYWKLTDCAHNYHYDVTADDEWIFYAAEDAGGVTLDLSGAPEGMEPLMKTGTATDLGSGKYSLFSDNGVIEFTLAPGGVKVNVTGETDALIKASEYVMDSEGENYFRVYVKIGYTVVPADENTEVTVGYVDENDDGSDCLHYHVNADAAAANSADSVTVRVEKITSAVLSFSEPDALLAEDPYGSDRGPILTNGDVIPAEGGWLLVGADCDPVFDDVGVTGELKAVSFDEPGTAIYKWYYIYPLKNGTVNVGMERSNGWHWAEVTVENPGGRDLYLNGYISGQDVQFQSETYTAWMVLSDRVTIKSVTGALVTLADIVPGKGVTKVLRLSGGRFALNVDPAAEKISFTVKAPEGTVTPTPGPTATPVPTATAAPTAAPAAAATAAPGTTSPRTGDETNLAPWALMLLGCGAALAAVILRRRARR